VRPWRWLCRSDVVVVSQSVQQDHLHGRTDSQQTRQEPNGSITAVQDTPDDGPVKARNL
jgi:hypothetical protein